MRHGWTVGRLQKLIAGADPNTRIMATASDHQYRDVSIELSTALLDKNTSSVSEDHFDDVEDNEVRIDILRIA